MEEWEATECDLPHLDNEIFQVLEDFHDSAHGLSLFSGCPYQPCKSVSPLLERVN